MATTSGYARPELLAEPDWLAQHVDDPSVRIIDCASPDAYRRAHIPGAIGLPGNLFIKDRNDTIHVMPPEDFAAFIGGLGVSNDSLVVTYDDNNSLNAARLWWVLNYYGHGKTRVLNGGWNRWLAEGRLISNVPTRPERATFMPRVDEGQVCLVEDLKSRVGSTGTTILDVRTNEEWLGTNSRGNKRIGHVPGAVHIEWLNFMTKDSHTVFRPASEIQELLAAQGVHPEQEVVTY